MQVWEAQENKSKILYWIPDNCVNVDQTLALLELMRNADEKIPREIQTAYDSLTEEQRADMMISALQLVKLIRFPESRMFK